jgi:hypothetical protein
MSAGRRAAAIVTLHTRPPSRVDRLVSTVRSRERSRHD